MSKKDEQTPQEQDNENSGNPIDGARNKLQGVSEAAANQIASSAVQSAVSSGASASAAASTGAAAGTAVGGPAGTAIGAAAGMLAAKLVKPAMSLLNGIALVSAFIVMIFQLLPSMLWENTEDLFSDTAPFAVYTEYKEYAVGKYEDALQDCKDVIESDLELEKESLRDDYDSVIITYSFKPTEAVFRDQFLDSSVLLVSMFEIGNDNWKNATFSDFKKKVDSVDFWNTLVESAFLDKKSETETIDGDSVIRIHYTYSLKDSSIPHFRTKFGVEDEKKYLKAVEMSYNIRVFFGESSGLPMGGVTSSGGRGSNATYPGGGTHDTIRAAISGLEEKYPFVGQTPIVPLPSGAWVMTSQFGPRNFPPDPIHTGLDFGAEEKTPIYAVMDGEVLLRLWGPKGFGNHIIIYHGGNVTTMYAHMYEFGSFQVGDKVNAGDVIGYVGDTGLSTNPHLHLEYQINGAAYNPRNYLSI